LSCRTSVKSGTAAASGRACRTGGGISIIYVTQVRPKSISGAW